MQKKAAVNLLQFALLLFSGILFSNSMTMLILYFNQKISWSDFGSSVDPTNLMTGPQLIIAQISGQIFGLLLPAFLVTINKSLIRSELSPRLFKLDSFYWILAFMICFLPSVAYSAVVNQSIPLPEWATSTEDKLAELLEKMLKMDSFSDYLVMMITAAVLPAVSEEWVFRGILQNQLKHLFKSQISAWLVSSIVFGVIHMQMEGVLPRILLGLLLGLVYWKTQCIWNSILLHFLFNGVQITAVYLLGETNIESNAFQSADLVKFLQIGAMTLFSLVPLFFISKKLGWISTPKTS